MRLVPLSELCAFRHGGTPSKAVPAFWSGGIPWVSPKDMKASAICDASDHITEAAVANSATSVVPPGCTLLVVRSGILAHTFPVALVTGPVAFNQDIKAVVPKSAKVSAAYVYWFLRSKASDVVSRGVKKGATVHSVQSGFIEGLQVPLVERDEQQRIVDLLSRAEGIVRLRRQAQQKAAELIPAIFADMFGDPATNPKGLEVVTLGEVLAGADYGSSSKASDADAGLPMIRMGNVDYSGNVDLSNLKYVELAQDDVIRFGLKDGDILFNRTNSKELVGKTGLWIGDREAIVASYFIRLRVSEKKARPFFVWAFMNTPHMKRVLFETARGAIGQANINSRELRAFRIPLPDLDEQARFESRCRDVLALRSQQRHAMAKAEAAFQALLAQAFAASSQPTFDREEATT